MFDAFSHNSSDVSFRYHHHHHPETNPNCLYFCIGILMDPAMGIKNKTELPTEHISKNSKTSNWGIPVVSFSVRTSTAFHPVFVKCHSRSRFDNIRHDPNSDHRKKRYMMMSSVTYSSVKYYEKVKIFHTPPIIIHVKKMEQRESFFSFPCWGFTPFPLEKQHNKNQASNPSGTNK